MIGARPALSPLLRHQLPYICGRIILTDTRPAFGHAGHEAGQFHQIYEPEQSARLPHDDLRVGSDGVGPLRRNRTDCAVIKAQQEALTLAVGPFANAGASPSAERVKGVGYKNLLRGSNGNVCFLR